MYVQELFRKYADWKILKHFLDNPDEAIHVQELSRKLDVSSGTASVMLKKAAAEGLLNRTEIGNVHLYQLNRRNDIVRALRRVVKKL